MTFFPPICFSLFMLVFFAATFGCAEKQSDRHHARVPVTVVKAAAKPFPVQRVAIGTVEPFNTVTVYSQVPGQILKVHFQEGQDVKKGMLLFGIDPSPYEENLNKARAQLVRETAQLEYDILQLRRYEPLVGTNAVSRTDYENRKKEVDKSRATVESSRAAVKDAEIMLSYCSIHSPVDGIAGARLADQGTVIKEISTKLLIINEVDPAYLSFSIPEKDLPDVRKSLSAGTLVIRASSPWNGNRQVDGKLVFIDNTVNKTSGMIRMKGQFRNTKGIFWPGQFLNVTVILGIQRNAVVIPAQAIKKSRQGEYIFVIRPDLTAEYREVTRDRTIGNEAVVSSGLRPGETVVTDGQLKLKEGFPVEIRTPETPEVSGS